MESSRGCRWFRDNAWAAACAAIYVAYAIVTLHAFSTTGPQVHYPHDGDTIAYLRMAAWPVFHPEFIMGERAFIYALLLKMTARDLSVAGHVQTFYALASWGLLAWSVLLLLDTARGKVLGFGLVLLCGMREEVLYWNSISLSESVSISSFALWIGSWVLFARGRHRFWRFFPLFTSFLVAFARDSNALLVLGAAILLAVTVACVLTKRWNLVTALVLVFFSVGSIASRSLSFRSQYALQNNIHGRILIDDWRTARLQELGMPRNLSQMERSSLAGRCGNDVAEVATVLVGMGRRRVSELFLWEKKHGQRSYLMFLLLNPDYSLLQPFREDGVLKFLFPLASWVRFHGCSPPLDTGMQPAFHTLFPAWMTRLLRGESPIWFLVTWAITVAASSAAVLRHPPSRRPFLLPLAVLLTAVPHLLAIWHGDALDVPRHALLVGIQVHLAFALALALACDAFPARRVNPRSGNQP